MQAVCVGILQKSWRGAVAGSGGREFAVVVAEDVAKAADFAACVEQLVVVEQAFLQVEAEASSLLLKQVDAAVDVVESFGCRIKSLVERPLQSPEFCLVVLTFADKRLLVVVARQAQPPAFGFALCHLRAVL